MTDNKNSELIAEARTLRTDSPRGDLLSVVRQLTEALEASVPKELYLQAGDAAAVSEYAARKSEAKLDRIRDAYAESVDDELSYNLGKLLEEDS